MTDYHVLVAVDPGGTTGVVTIDNAATSWLAFPDRHEFERWMGREFARGLGDRGFHRHIVCESWVSRKGPLTAQYDAQLIIGWLDGVTAVNPHKGTLYMQQAGDRMWTTSAKLKAAGLNYPNDHAKQAARHAVRWIMQHPEVTGPNFDYIRQEVTRVIQEAGE